MARCSRKAEECNKENHIVWSHVRSVFKASMLAAQKFDRRALQFTVKAATLPSSCPSSFFYLSIRSYPRLCISALLITICSFVLRSKIVQQQSHQRRRGCWQCQQGFVAKTQEMHADNPFWECYMLIDRSDTSSRRVSRMALSACTEFAHG
jgi:hypothetical protein